MITEHRFNDAEGAAADLAQWIGAILTQAIADRGTALLALSGGRSPRAVLQQLSDMPIDWAKVTLIQVDERWVAPDHADSNQMLIRDALLQGPAQAACFVPMKNDAADPYAGQRACEAALAGLTWPVDVMLLGMGEDGHTASLFPAAAELAQGLTSDALTLAVTPPSAPHPRMSLSLRAILHSRHIVLQIGGAAKEAVFRAALGEGPVEAMPIRAVLRSDTTPVDVWISD